MNHNICIAEHLLACGRISQVTKGGTAVCDPVWQRQSGAKVRPNSVLRCGTEVLEQSTSDMTSCASYDDEAVVNHSISPVVGDINS